jgi:hypothetical protein
MKHTASAANVISVQHLVIIRSPKYLNCVTQTLHLSQFTTFQLNRLLPSMKTAPTEDQDAATSVPQQRQTRAQAKRIAEDDANKPSDDPLSFPASRTRSRVKIAPDALVLGTIEKWGFPSKGAKSTAKKAQVSAQKSDTRPEHSISAR